MAGWGIGLNGLYGQLADIANWLIRSIVISYETIQSPGSIAALSSLRIHREILIEPARFLGQTVITPGCYGQSDNYLQSIVGIKD